MPDPRDGIDPNKLLVAALIGLLLFLLAGALFAQELPAGTTLDPREAVRVSQRAVGTTVGDYTLWDSDGSQVRLADYRGRPLLLSFVYTGCFQVCPATTAFLARAVAEAQRTLGATTFNVVTVGFNWPFDNPVALREFRQRHGLDTRGWAFLAADRATVQALARDVGFQWVATAGGFDHVTQVTLVDAQGRVLRQVYGDEFELPLLIAPLRDLVVSGRTERADLGALVERVRILCTVYDPRSGRYRLDYGLFIEIFAGLSILGATLAYLAREWRRHRRPRPA